MEKPTLTLALTSEETGHSHERFEAVVVYLDTRGAVYNTPRAAVAVDWYPRETIRSIQRHNTGVINRATRRGSNTHTNTNTTKREKSTCST
jgi:hypothetical protein